MKWMTLALLGTITACSAATSNQPHATASNVASPRAAFEKYETFSFAPANPPTPGYETTARSLEVQRRLTPIVKASLEERGYSESTETPDLLIKLSAGSGAVTGDEAKRGDVTAHASRGFIGIDAYDRATGAEIWRGTAVAEIDPARIDEALLTRGVESMLEGFPVQREPRAQAALVH